MTQTNEPAETDTPCQSDGTSRFFMNTIALSSRWLFLLTVLGSALISIALFVFGFLSAVTLILNSFSIDEFTIESMKNLMAASIQIIDLFLVATVFYIISLGFYELFIAKAPLPGWLKICSLDDLKTKLLEMYPEIKAFGLSLSLELDKGKRSRRRRPGPRSGSRAAGPG